MSLTTVIVVAVAHRHARRLLAAVLQGVQPEVGEVSDGLARGVHAEDAARFLRGCRRLAWARRGLGSAEVTALMHKAIDAGFRVTGCPIQRPGVRWSAR